MKKYIAHLSIFIITLWSISFVGCKKADTVIENPSPQHIVATFFNRTANLPAATQRIATLLRQKEQYSAFAANFIKQQGIPLWQSATVNYRAPAGTPYHYQRNGMVESTDTIIKIPLQLQGVQAVHGYLLCTLSASGVAVAVIDGRQYAQYGFLNDAPNEVAAENIAAEIMQFNYAIFGYNHFVITDKRLFGNERGANVIRTVRFDSAANNDVGSRAGLCPGGRVTVSVATTVQHCPYPAGQCTGPNGTCDGCTQYNCATYSTEVYSFCNQDAPPSSSPQAVVWTLEQPTDPAGGGVIPPGWVPTPADPCITTTAGAIATTICGLGWVNGTINPFEFQKSNFDDLYTGDDDNNLVGNIDTTSYLPYQIGQPWDTVSNVISIADFVGWGTPGIAKNCMSYAKAQIAKNGYAVSNYNTVGQTIQVYTAAAGADSTKVKDAIGYLMSALNRGIPVIVGIDDQIGSSNPQTDATTDHFVVIVGMGTDATGNYFTFYDNASGYARQGAHLENKLYFNPTTWLISGNSQTVYASGLIYTITMIRKSK